METRSETISYSKARRKEFKKRKTYLQENPDTLDNEILRQPFQPTTVPLDDYAGIKTELKEIYEETTN